ncbi:unnamed protein product, partial [Choristocarpus tenellus]
MHPLRVMIFLARILLRQKTPDGCLVPNALTCVCVCACPGEQGCRFIGASPRCDHGCCSREHNSPVQSTPYFCSGFGKGFHPPGKEEGKESAAISHLLHKKL